MLQPKAYVKKKEKIYKVRFIDFDNETVELFDEPFHNIYAYVYDFEEIDFVENTGFKDKYKEEIYVGYTVTLDDEYGDEYKVMQDEDELTFYLEPIKPFSITDKEIQLRKSMEYKITITER